MQSTCRRFASSASSRTYNDALEKLVELQSNRTITRLFDNTTGGKSNSGHVDLNAAALPEMRAWLLRAGYKPQDLAAIRHIHVAGTKGKGSVCAHATAMLREHYAQGAVASPVGTYTSPHLVSPRERIAIDGQPVAKDVFAKAFFEIWDRLTEAALREGKPASEAESAAARPFYFRLLTIVAWHIFLTLGVRDVVMECGIGGEHDATNVLPPEAVSAFVVTQLGVDHVAMLGDTVDKIAWHKAGVAKQGVRGFTRRLDGQPGVMDVLRRRVAEKGGQLVEVPDELVRQWGGVEGGLKGDFQKYNQALALLAVREHLNLDSDPAVSFAQIPEALELGLKKASLRGRCEVLADEGGTSWLLDVAHTNESLDEVAKWFLSQLDDGEKATLVFNAQDRDPAGLLSWFLESIEKVQKAAGVSARPFGRAIFTTNELKRPAPEDTRDVSLQAHAATVMAKMAPGCETIVVDNIQDAVERARTPSAEDGGRPGKVLVTGSFRLVGGVMEAIEPDSLQ